jgi:hypothetical protein
VLAGKTARDKLADDVVVLDVGRLLHREGVEHARWILLDYGAVVVHVFHREAREFYHLERLWADAAPVSLPPQRSVERRMQPRGDEADLL